MNELFCKRLLSFLDRNLDNVDLNAELVSKALRLSKSTLNRRLKALGNPTINVFIKAYRLKKSMNILSAGYKVRDVTRKVGFKNPSYFTQCFKAHYHQTPTVFARNSLLTQN